MDDLSQFIEWFPDIIKPVLAQRDEAVARLRESEAKLLESEARLQELEAKRTAGRQLFRQKMYRTFQRKFHCEISSSQIEKLEYLDNFIVLANIDDYLEETENREDFDRFIDEELQKFIGQASGRSSRIDSKNPINKIPPII